MGTTPPDYIDANGFSRSGSDTTGTVNNPQATGVITTSQLSTQPALQFPPTPSYQDYSGDIQGALASAQTLYNQDNQALDQANQQQQQGVNALAKLYADVGLKASDTAQMEQDKGIPGMQTDVQNLTNTLNGLQAEANIIPLQMQQNAQGQGVTDRGLAPIQAAAKRENAIKVLTTTALLHAKQGNLTLAQNQVDRAINLKYAPLENAIAQKEKLLELNQKYFVTPAEKKRAEDLQKKNELEKAQLADKKESEKSMSDMLYKAIQGGLPTDMASTVQKGIDQGTLTVPQVETMVGGYTSALPASAQEYQFAVRNGYKGTYSQYQTEDANRKALKASGSSPITPQKPLKSGTLIYTAQDQSEDSRALESSRGQDGYVDPSVYQKLYQAWVDNGGLLKDFLAHYPPKNYVNPANTWLPAFLMPPTTKKTSSSSNATASGRER